MMAAFEGLGARLGERARRIGGWIRRHPWRTVAAAPLAVVVYVVALYPFTPSIGDIRKTKQESPTIVLSADGQELAVFKRANRDWVKLSDISPKVVEALLATEDHRFHEHFGIDVARTGRAVLNTLMGDVEGGSTITQQLARNLYPEEIGRAQTVTRKVKEAITALKIEAIYSKEEILESYLNSVSFLYNAWGIEMAAKTYFAKSARELNELEAATLIGMLKGTSYYNPVLNPDRALDRRNTVLAQLVRHDKLSQERFDKLKAQPLKLDFERVQEFNGTAPHLAEYLKRWLLEWADRHDYNIYADGLVVRTTIDSRLQQMANQAVKRQGDLLQAVADVEWSRPATPALGTNPEAYAAARNKAAAFDHFWGTHKDLLDSFVKDTPEFRAAREQGQSAADALQQLKSNSEFMANLRRQKTMLQAGFLAIEPTTGHVKAWVGSRDYGDDKFDHVQQARRQPGSTFKPFVYGAAFESGMNPNDTLMDAPVEIQIDRNKVWRPTDVGDGPTNQPMTLREALSRSKNTITAQVMMRVGPSRVASLARSMGVRQSKLDEVPSLALGTSPVTLKEMVTSFATLANSGSYIEPTLVTAVEDRDKNVLESFGAHVSEQAMGTEAAHMLLDALRGTIEFGTAVGLKHRFGLGGDLAGKTGTTQDNTDGWFILMHPQLVAGAWMGFNDNRVAMRSEYWGQGSHNALLVVGDFFQQAARANLVNSKSAFAAPRQQATEAPLLQRMGDWWNSVFNTAPPEGSTAETAAVAGPEVRLEPPVLLPAPEAMPPLPPLPPLQPQQFPAPVSSFPPLPSRPPADAPVVISGPERVPAFPRPLDDRGWRSNEPVTVPGTQVYRAPEPLRPRSEVLGAPPASASSGSPSSAFNSSVIGGSSTLEPRPARSPATPAPLGGAVSGSQSPGFNSGSSSPALGGSSTGGGTLEPRPARSQAAPAPLAGTGSGGPSSGFNSGFNSPPVGGSSSGGTLEPRPARSQVAPPPLSSPSLSGPPGSVPVRELAPSSGAADTRSLGAGSSRIDSPSTGMAPIIVDSTE